MYISFTIFSLTKLYCFEKLCFTISVIEDSTCQMLTSAAADPKGAQQPSPPQKKNKKKLNDSVFFLSNFVPECLRLR